MAIETGATETKSQKRLKKKKATVDQDTGEIEEDFLDEPIPTESVEMASIQVDPDGEFHRASFIKLQVVAKKDETDRTLDIQILSHLSEFKTGYSFIMVFNEEPYLNRITSELRAKADFEAQNQTELFGEAREAELKKFDDRVAGIKEEKEAMRAKCPEIKFHGGILNIDTSRSFPTFTVQINDTSVNQLNDAWPVIRNYKVQLQ